jgi:hypothetical protein
VGSLSEDFAVENFLVSLASVFGPQSPDLEQSCSSRSDELGRDAEGAECRDGLLVDEGMLDLFSLML